MFLLLLIRVINIGRVTKVVHVPSTCDFTVQSNVRHAADFTKIQKHPEGVSGLLLVVTLGLVVVLLCVFLWVFFSN